MIKICNIYTIPNQIMYTKEDMCMILAHLAERGLYKESSFLSHQYIIMDNGAYEKQQVSTDLEYLIWIVKTRRLPVNEIVVPDVVNNFEENLKLFEKNIPVMKKYQHEYNFMFVAQSTTYEELRKNIEYINDFYRRTKIRVCVGISKLTPLKRDSDEAIEIYSHCRVPIHFLGIKKDLKEIDKVEHLVRSVDTCHITHTLLNKGIDCVKRARRSSDVEVDLQYHKVNEELIDHNLYLLRMRKYKRDHKFLNELSKRKINKNKENKQ